MRYLLQTFMWFCIVNTTVRLLQQMSHFLRMPETRFDTRVGYFAAESLRTIITRYATGGQRTQCLPVIYSSGKSNEYLIILDFLWKEVNILKKGFWNFHSISSSYEIINYFIFTSWSIIAKFCMHVQVRGMNRS